MAASLKVLVDDQPVGSKVREILVVLTGDNSYPTGGYPVGSAQGLPTVTGAGGVTVTPAFVAWEVAPGASATQTYTAAWDYTANKVKVSRDNGEVSNGTNLSSASLRGRLLYVVG